jgi:hypothetical protein
LSFWVCVVSFVRPVEATGGGAASRQIGSGDSQRRPALRGPWSHHHGATTMEPPAEQLPPPQWNHHHGATTMEPPPPPPRSHQPGLHTLCHWTRHPLASQLDTRWSRGKVSLETLCFKIHLATLSLDTISPVLVFLKCHIFLTQLTN